MRKLSSQRRRRSFVGDDRARRRLRLEQLEDRRLLTGGINPLVGPVALSSALDSGETVSGQWAGAEGESGSEVIRFRLAATNAAGQTISSIELGDSFQLRVYVTDVRPADAEGVFSAYLDVLYDSALATVSGPVVHTDTYPNLPSGDTSQPGLVDELGGFDGLNPLGSSEYLLAIVPFAASAHGMLTFTGESADILPMHDVLFFGAMDPVPSEQIDFGQTSLKIREIIDNGDTGFSTTGAWVFAPGLGFGNDIHYSAPGNGADVARWTFTVTPGRYRVSATWGPHKNAATNTPYTVLDGTTALATVRVNQEVSANDFQDASSWWEDLGGPYVVSGMKLVVQVSDAANEYVEADAVRIERLPDLPEIQVSDAAALLADGANLNFGSAVPGMSVDKVLTVKNVGTQPLTLGSLSGASFPAGFRLQQDFGSLNLAPNASTTFTIRMESATPGNFSGPISFVNNDGDENPFDLTLTGKVGAVIIDNSGAGFSPSGEWTFAPGLGYNNNIHYSAPGSGADVGRWTFDVVPGRYRVSATWGPHPSAATNTPYTVLDGTTPLGTIRLNQEVAANDFQDAGAAWEDLGSAFAVLGTTLVVQVSDAANEYVEADAVRIERLADAPEIQVSDGSTIIADGATLSFGSAVPEVAVDKVLTVKNLGTRNLTLNSLSGASFPTGFRLQQDFGSLDLAPGAATTFTIRMLSSSPGSFSGAISFVNNDGDENPFDLALAGKVGAVIIDNGDAGFSTVGSWTLAPGLGFSNDIHYSAPGGGADVARWTFTVTPGRYRVSATWGPHPNAATNTPYSILDGNTALGTVRMNQEVAANDFQDAAAWWEDLGSSYVVTGTTLIVQVSDSANEYAEADAVRIERIADSPVIIDNGEGGFSTSGAWTAAPGIGFKNDIHYSAPGNGTDVARWTFSVTPGRYRVSATWGPHPDAATNTPYTVLDGSTVLGTVQVNREVAANDFQDANSWWEDLGTSYVITGNTLVVRVSDAANDYVEADAVRIERLSDMLRGSGDGAGEATPLATTRGEQSDSRPFVYRPQQNAARVWDVNNDGVVSPRDALLVLNHLNRPEQTGTSLVSLSHYLDVDGNGSVSPRDALLVLNRLSAARATDLLPEADPGWDFDSIGSRSALLPAADTEAALTDLSAERPWNAALSAPFHTDSDWLAANDLPMAAGSHEATTSPDHDLDPQAQVHTDLLAALDEAFALLV